MKAYEEHILLPCNAETPINTYNPETVKQDEGVVKETMLATVTRGLLLLLMIGLVTSEISTEQDSSLNQVADNSVERSGKMSSSSTRTVLAEMAREMIMRSTTNSQVLSLNLTNLFILLVLKALLFGAGLFSFGFLKNGGGYYARSGGEPLFSDPRTNPLVTENEILLLVSYLMGDANNDFTCLHRIACEEPAKAREYLVAAKMLIKGAKMFNTVVPYNPKYEAVVGKFQEAVEFGSSGAKCDARYSCSSRSSR